MNASSHCCSGANKNVYGYTSDLESGKAKFLAAKDSEHERDYVARYGQKAYRMGSGNQMASMPQPLTPGHTSTLKIKALPEQDMPAPGMPQHLLCFLSPRAFMWLVYAFMWPVYEMCIGHGIHSKQHASAIAAFHSSTSGWQPCLKRVCLHQVCHCICCRG